MANQLNFTFPIEELAAALLEKLMPALHAINEKQALPDAEKFLTRKETAAKLKISLPTLNEYTKRNIITGYRFGVRVLYKQSEIETAISKMHFN